MSFRPTASAGPASSGSASSPVGFTVAGAARKAYSPPLFGSFGKKAKDLFKKKYEFENQATVKSSSVDGLNISTAIVSGADNNLRGVFTSSLPVRSYGLANGVFESEFHTVADKESKTSYKLTKLAPGLSVKFTLVGVKPEVKGETPDFPEGWAAAEAEYTQEYFTGSIGVRTNQQKTLIDATGALGYDSFSVGGKVVVDTSSQAAPGDWNVGAQYEGADYVASAVTEKKRSVVSLSYFQSVARTQVIGASASFGLIKPSRSLTVGTDYQVDPDTTIRAYAKVEAGKDAVTVATNVEHRLLHPNALLGVSAEFALTPASQTTNKLGVSLTFGDY